MSQTRQTPADEPHYLVRVSMADLPTGYALDRHAHDWPQLVYASAGVMTVWTQAGSWVAPPSWAVWVPGGVDHAIRFTGQSAMRSLYVRPGAGEGLPEDCTVVAVSPLLRELILRTVELGRLDDRRPADRAMAALIFEELTRHPAAAFDLPMPADPAARQAARLLENGDAGPDLARQVGLSRRTLERRFQDETGLSLGQWRRQARLLNALRGLAAGEAVKAVAERAGYRTPSAFVAAFRTAFGTTPGRYFS
jgi:AraC-like DNA-binding protein/quercetin dioxygenase-like cupin family protein